MNTNYSVGHEAEKRAAEYLAQNGFEIEALNWTNHLAEVDIIAKKDKRINFIEVKYRRTENQGSGLDYITPKKLQQMQRAAEMWVHENKWRGEYTLGALELAGENFAVTNFVENIV